MRPAEYRIRILFLAAAVFLAGIGIVAWRNHALAGQANRQVMHTDAVLAEVQSIRVKVAEIQAAVREVVLPGSDASRYRQAAAAFPAHLERLASMVSDSPAETARVVRLRGLVLRWQGLTDAFIADVASKGVEDAFMKALNSPDWNIVFRVSGILSDMAGEEHRLLAEQTQEQARRDAASTNAFLVFGFAGAALLLFSYLAAIRELRARQQAMTALALSEERFRLLVDNVPDYSVVMLDLSGHVVTWNRGAERLNGYRAAEITGTHFSVFHPPEDVTSGKCARLLSTAAVEGHAEDEGLRVRKDGSRFWATVTIAPVRGEQGELRGFAKVTRDVTERRRAEEDRLRLAQADEGIRVRDEIMSVASHELRTPLTPLSLHLQKMRRLLRAGERPDPETVSRALRQIKRLDELIADLLDLTRVREGRLDLELETVDLAALVETAASDFKGVSDRHEIVIDAPGPVPVRGDPGRLEQVVVNLVQNAVKYSPTGGRIEVSVGVEGGEARVSVRDTGIGIPGDEQGRIFDRFFRARNAQHKEFGGLGLGLFLSHEVVARHGGRFEVQSAVGEGSTFTFSLPLAEAQASATPPAMETAGRRVLVIDDDPDILLAVGEALRELGYDVATATNGLDALDRLGSLTPDVMLVDLMMPLLDGAAFIERVRQDHLVPETPIVVISADHQAVARARTGTLHVEAALTKPLDVEELDVTITRLLRFREGPARTA